MFRVKITTQEKVTFKNPMTYLVNGNISPLKVLCGKCDKFLVEKNGECFVVVSPTCGFGMEGILVPVIGSIDDYDGKEISIEELKE